jgi:GDPmannose 4,6-dehydratase
MTDVSQRALICGVTGQDGALLAQYLLTLGYEVHGTSRREGASQNLQQLGIAERVRLHRLDPADATQVSELLAAVRPFEIYDLSGQSSAGLSFEKPRETFVSHVSSTLAILEAVRTSKLDCRSFHASSGEVFGETAVSPADEGTALAPCTPYGAAKAAATLLVKSYRDAFGLFACSAFLFNHESLLRPERFVTQRIAQGAAAIKTGRAAELKLGNLKVVRDWGWAPDYVECMRKMLQQDRPRDYVVATGVGASLEEFVERVFRRFDLDWKEYVVRDESLVRRVDIPVSVGNPRAAEQHLGWRAQARMPEVADRLADAAFARMAQM